MGRPRGSKNKAAIPLEEKGNPSFNLKDAVPVKDGWDTIAPSAPTAEDLAFDRELEMMARTSEPVVTDMDNVPQVKKTIDPYTLLSDFEDDYKPADTIQELDDQVMRAKHFEADSIEAVPKLIKFFCKKDYPDKVGYFMYHDIRVYIAGFFEQSKLKEQVTIEQKNFGHSKVL